MAKNTQDNQVPPRENWWRDHFWYRHGGSVVAYAVFLGPFIGGWLIDMRLMLLYPVLLVVLVIWAVASEEGGDGVLKLIAGVYIVVMLFVLGMKAG